MTMRERINQGKLFTDMCEGLPEERMAAKHRMHLYNSSCADDLSGRMEMLTSMLGQAEGIWIEPPFYFCYGIQDRPVDADDLAEEAILRKEKNNG